MQHFTVAFLPEGRRETVHPGTTLLEAAARADIILNSICGGKGTCGKCKVLLKPDNEEVLACQYHVNSDLTVEVPPESRFYQQKILEHGISRRVALNPAVTKLAFVPDSLRPATVLADLAARLHTQNIDLTETARAQLASLTPPPEKTITAVCFRPADSDTACRVLAFEPGDTTAALYGVAIDIGTTTVVTKLLDLRTGRILAAAADTNPQIERGDDVVTRIAYTTGAPDGLARLHNLIINTLNRLIRAACTTAAIKPDCIYEVTVAANTTMNHIFRRLPVEQLGRAPYKAYSLEPADIPAAELNLKINPAGTVHTIENIAGFVGSDTTAVALTVALEQITDETLVVDIGTNGEIILAARGKYYAASCAAGPALEGARIRCGSRAAAGAVENVTLENDDIHLDVIGSDCPRTICGSGLIDAVALLLNLGIIDSTGRFSDPESLKGNIPDPVFARLTQLDGRPAFTLAQSPDAERPPVVLTQKDIREVQLAKGAIRAGIRILQDKLNLTDSDTKRIFVAGAFGNYIDPAAAVRIGLIPDVPTDRIRFIGNAAESGAIMTLLSRDCRKLSAKIARLIEYVEIAHQPQFASTFAETMLFPE